MRRRPDITASKVLIRFIRIIRGFHKNPNVPRYIAADFPQYPCERKNKPTKQRSNYENTQNEPKSFPIASSHCYRALVCRGLGGVRNLRASVELDWQLYTNSSPPSGYERLPMGAAADHDRRRRHGVTDNADGSALVWIDTRSAKWG